MQVITESKTYHIYKAILQTISSPNSIEGIKINSKKSHINKATLDEEILFFGGPEPT
jgi:hypothetical protein